MSEENKDFVPDGMFIFNYTEVRVLLYEYKDAEKGSCIGFLTATPDRDNDYGLLQHSVPKMNSSIAVPYDSKKKLLYRFKTIKAITLNRPNFSFIYEGQINGEGFVPISRLGIQ